MNKTNEIFSYIPIWICFRLITSTVRLPKPKPKDLIDAETLVNRTGIINNYSICTVYKLFSDKEHQQQQQDEDNNAENISDEGIDDPGSDSGTAPYDYLVSSVSKSDLDLMSMWFNLINSLFYFYFNEKKNIMLMMMILYH
jgi:hypothetical protein